MTFKLPNNKKHVVIFAMPRTGGSSYFRHCVKEIKQTNRNLDHFYEPESFRARDDTSWTLFSKHILNKSGVEPFIAKMIYPKFCHYVRKDMGQDIYEEFLATLPFLEPTEENQKVIDFVTQSDDIYKIRLVRKNLPETVASLILRLHRSQLPANFDKNYIEDMAKLGFDWEAPIELTEYVQKLIRRKTFQMTRWHYEMQKSSEWIKFDLDLDYDDLEFDDYDNAFSVTPKPSNYNEVIDLVKVNYEEVLDNIKKRGGDYQP